MESVPLHWKLVKSQADISETNKRLADILNLMFKNEEVVVVGILKGAIYFYVDLTRLLTFRFTQYFIEACSYMDSHTQAESVKILNEIDVSKFLGKKVLLLDELYDNGLTINTVKHKIHEVTKIELNDIITCTIFKKDKEVTVHPPDLYGLVVPNLWLVGYGLDDKQEYRQLQNLYAINT